MMYNFGASEQGIKLKLEPTPRCYNQKNAQFYKDRLVLVAQSALLCAMGVAFAVVCVLLSQ